MNSLFQRRRGQFTAERLEELHQDLQCLAATGRLPRRPRRLPAFFKAHISPSHDDVWLSWSAFRELAVAGAAPSDDSNRDPDQPTTDLSSAESYAEAERLVTETILSMVEILVNDPRTTASSRSNSLRGDGPFEYVCETQLLAYLVGMAKERPPGVRTSSSETSKFHPVAWSSAVKATILRALALLLTRSEGSALYYLVSRHCLNELLLCVVPMHQWTDPALEEILPAYVDLLKSLVNQLRANPFLLPLLVMDKEGAGTGSGSSLPVLSCTLEAIKSSYTFCDSFSHATCLNLLVDLMLLEPVQRFLGDTEQRELCGHFAQLFIDRYDRLKTLTSGPVVNGSRSNVLKDQIRTLDDDVDLLNDIFGCEIRPLNVRLCETLLDRLVALLLKDFSPPSNRHFLAVGVMDNDVIPSAEASSQVSVFFFSRLFDRVAYAPLVRMLAVALFHPQSTRLWLEPRPDSEQYPLTTSLQNIVDGTVSSYPNAWRAQLVELLSGNYGEWRLVPAAILLENVIKCPFMDTPTLAQLSIIAKFEEEWHATPIEVAVADFLERNHALKSDVSYMALECMSTVALELLHSTTIHFATSAHVQDIDPVVFKDLPTRRALIKVRDDFFDSTTQSAEVMGVADMFVDFVEAAIKNRYKRATPSTQRASLGSAFYSCVLSHYGAASFATNPEVLIRKQRAAIVNEVESTRFNTQMAIHFRAACRIMERYQEKVDEWLRDHSNGQGPPVLDMHDKLEDLVDVFGTQRFDAVGANVDIRGRMAFRFVSPGSPNKSADTEYSDESAAGRSSQPFGQLILVLDPTSMLIVKPATSDDSQRGTLLCTIPLLCVIASACDNEWLHVAVKHHDVGSIIKNGNAMLRFESSGTCLIVANYLERSLARRRGELTQEIKGRFAVKHEDCRLQTAEPSQSTTDSPIAL